MAAPIIALAVSGIVAWMAIRVILFERWQAWRLNNLPRTKLASPDKVCDPVIRPGQLYALGGVERGLCYGYGGQHVLRVVSVDEQTVTVQNLFVDPTGGCIRTESPEHFLESYVAVELV